MVLKQDGSGMPISSNDFRIGLDVGIFGRSIRIYDCDEYTRLFFEVRYIKIKFELNIEFKNGLTLSLISPCR